MKTTSNVYQFLIILKQVEEGKFTEQDIREIVEWEIKRSKKEPLETLYDIKLLFKKLEDIFLPVVVDMVNEKIDEESREKSNVVNMNITHSINDLTNILRVSRKTIYNYMDDGRLGYVQLGNNKRVVTQEQLDRFLKP